MSLPRFVLGHNSLIGVDHWDRTERGPVRTLSREDRSFLEEAEDAGVEALILDNHPVAREAGQYIEEEDLDIDIIPMVPYAQGLVDELSKDGLGGYVSRTLRSSLRRPLSSAGILKDVVSGNVTDAGARVGLNFLLEDFPSNLGSVIFLHNAVTDLLIGWGAWDAISAFSRACHNLGKDPGVVTQNTGLITEIERNVPDIEWFMCPVNSAGIQMSPGQEEAENSLKECGTKVLGMSVLGGGVLDPREAIRYAVGFPSVHSLTIGTTTPPHLREALHLVGKSSEREFI